QPAAVSGGAGRGRSAAAAGAARHTTSASAAGRQRAARALDVDMGATLAHAAAAGSAPSAGRVPGVVTGAGRARGSPPKPKGIVNANLISRPRTRALRTAASVFPWRCYSLPTRRGAGAGVPEQ